MKYIFTKNLDTSNKELYIVSNNFNVNRLLEAFDSGFKYYNTWRDWVRQPRDIINSEIIEIFNINSLDKPLFKYIVIEDEEDSQESLLIFPTSINHDDFKHSVLMSGDSFFKVKAAGFTDLKNFTGRSETLNLNSREKDKDLFL